MAFALPVKVIPVKAPSSRCEATSNCYFLLVHVAAQGTKQARFWLVLKRGSISAGLGSSVATNCAGEHTAGL